MLGSYLVDVMLLATDLGWPAASTATPLACRCCWRRAVPHLWLWGRQPAGGHQEHHRDPRGGDQGVLAGWTTWPARSLLRARGVQIQDLPELGTVDGIADIGFALAAWFVDPHHNWIGLLQLKDPAGRPHGAAIGTGQADVSKVPGSEEGELAHGQGRWADHRQL